MGANGVGKSTLFRVLAGLLPADDGDVDIGTFAYMPQDVGVGPDSGRTVRELLLEAAPARLRDAGERMVRAERELAAGADPSGAGMRLGEAIGDWSELGGYELEGQWDAACRRIVRAGLDEVGGRDTTQLSGGERKQLVLEVLFASDAAVLLLDEPDNFLDVPAKLALEQRIAASKKTIVLISHDRDLLGAATNTILTLEANGTWVHGGSYRTYPEAREKRQQLLGDRLEQWKREERRLFQFYKIMKQRAAISDVNAKRADAAETRWRRFVDVGPPPAPVKDQQIQVRIPGGDSARIVVAVRDVAIEGLVKTFEDEIHFGERVGLIGPNGSGKTHLIRLLAGEDVPHTGELRIGNRVSAGLFTQLNSRADLEGRGVLDVVQERLGALEPSMRALARYRIQDAANRIDRHALGRPEGAAGDPLPRARGAQPAAARRADRQPRHRLLRGPRGRAGVVRRDRRGRLARPRVPAPAGPLPAAGPRRRGLRAARHRVGAGGARRARARGRGAAGEAA